MYDGTKNVPKYEHRTEQLTELLNKIQLEIYKQYHHSNVVFTK